MGHAMKSLLTFAIAATVIAAPASAVTYDVFSSFDGVNNPAGPYTFGYISADLSTFTAFSTANFTSLEGGQLSVLTGPEAALGAYKNVSGSAFTAFTTADVPAGALFLHPGPSLFSAIVFTAPTSAVYKLTLAAKLLSNSTITGTDVVFGFIDGNTVLPQTSFSLTQATPANSFNGMGPLVAGKSVFVAVGPAGDYQFDSTQVTFTLSNNVPEPASWALLIVGFGLTGTVLRRRRTMATA
jgi:hypothetical protein